MERECGDLPFGEYLNLPMTILPGCGKFRSRVFLSTESPIPVGKNVGWGLAPTGFTAPAESGQAPPCRTGKVTGGVFHNISHSCGEVSKGLSNKSFCIEKTAALLEQRYNYCFFSSSSRCFFRTRLMY